MSKRKAPAGCYWRGATLWGRVTVKGQEIRWSLRTGDAKIAAKRLKERREREIAAYHFSDQRRTYEDAATAWAAWIEGQVSPASAKRYAGSLKQIEPHVLGLYLDEITGRLIGQIVTDRQRQAVTNATIRRDLTALSSVLTYAEAMEWRDGNPALSWLKRLTERRDPIVLPSDADIARVIARAPGMMRDLIRAALATGCRLEELASATRFQVDPQRKQLTLIGKGNKRRTIDLMPFGGWDLFSTLPAHIKEPWVFWHHDGQRYENLSSRFAAITREIYRDAKAAAADGTPDFRPFRFHDLRHRHAVDWLKSGRSIYDLQQRLGHSSIKTTEIYLQHLTPDEMRIAKYANLGTNPGT